jgi:hypothetical protein
MNQLKRAMEAQAEDEECEEPLNTVAKSASASQVQQRTEKDEKKSLDRRVRDNTLQESMLSRSQQEHHKSLMEAERIQRQVMMEEISSIHCSGSRDKNTQ